MYLNFSNFGNYIEVRTLITHALVLEWILSH